MREASGDTMRVVRGAIRVGEPRRGGDRVVEPDAARSDRGAAAAGQRRRRQRRAEAARRRCLAGGARAPAGRAAPRLGAGAATAPAPLVFDASGGAGYVPDAIALRVGELVLGSRRLDNVTAGLSQQAELWRANVDCRRARRLRRVPAGAARAPVGAGRVFARLSRLSLPKGEVERVESLLDDAAGDAFPALDVVVDDFELRGKRLGRLEIEATNRGAGGREGAREWQLAKLNLTMPEAQLAASGTWGAPARRRRRRRAARR